jgi:hypothetical protein
MSRGGCCRASSWSRALCSCADAELPPRARSESTYHGAGTNRSRTTGVRGAGRAGADGFVVAVEPEVPESAVQREQVCPRTWRFRWNPSPPFDPLPFSRDLGPGRRGERNPSRAFAPAPLREKTSLRLPSIWKPAPVRVLHKDYSVDLNRGCRGAFSQQYSAPPVCFSAATSEPRRCWNWATPARSPGPRLAACEGARLHGELPGRA